VDDGGGGAKLGLGFVTGVLLGFTTGEVEGGGCTGRVVGFVTSGVVFGGVLPSARATRCSYGSERQLASYNAITAGKNSPKLRLTWMLLCAFSTGTAKTGRERASAMQPATRMLRVGFVVWRNGPADTGIVLNPVLYIFGQCPALL
jgi:hypothetical protein